MLEEGAPFAVVLDEEVSDEELLEVREVDVADVDEVESLVLEEVSVEPLAVSSGESDPHPTRARTARPAAARVR